MRATTRFKSWKTTAAVAAAAILLAVGGQLSAQGALVQLGLTETAARAFVLSEIRGPASDRRSDIAITGTRAFLKLPPSARGAAATGLFAWARTYANSPAFKAVYESYRQASMPQGQYGATVEETIKKEMDESRAAMEQMEKHLAASELSPAERQKIMAEILAAEASTSYAAQIEKFEQKTPANPQRLIARRLREFLEITADVNFSARTISLTGGPDGIEFIDKANRERHWIWQQAAIVGSEATVAARAAAQAWLKEIEP